MQRHVVVRSALNVSVCSIVTYFSRNKTNIYQKKIRFFPKCVIPQAKGAEIHDTTYMMLIFFYLQLWTKVILPYICTPCTYCTYIVITIKRRCSRIF